MVSEEGKALISKMLQSDPEMRISGSEAIKDPWFAKFSKIEVGSAEDKLDQNIINKLKKYKGVS